MQRPPVTPVTSGVMAALAGTVSAVLASCFCVTAGAATAPQASLAQLLPAPSTAIQLAPAAPQQIEPAGSIRPPDLQPSGPVGAAPIRIAPAGNPAQAVELARLRALASRQAARGSAAARTTAGASWLLGLIYLHGSGVPADAAQAAAWFRRARMMGEPLASAGLAWCAMDGCGKLPDPAGARPWISLLRPADAPRAAYMEWLAEERLAPLRLAPAGGSSQTRRPAAGNRALLVRAANGGNVHARIELGIEAYSQNRLDEAMEQFRAAARRSSAAAANLLVVQSELGQRRPQTATAETAPLQVPAADPSAPPPGADNTIRLQGGDGSAGQTLADARRYHRGDGVPSNYTEAIRLYQLAATKGSVEARRMLALIASRPMPDGQIDIAWMQQLAWVDVSGSTPRLESAVPSGFLQREPTPLTDLLPELWRPSRDVRPR